MFTNATALFLAHFVTEQAATAAGCSVETMTFAAEALLTMLLGAHLSPRLTAPRTRAGAASDKPAVIVPVCVASGGQQLASPAHLAHVMAGDAATRDKLLSVLLEDAQWLPAAAFLIDMLTTYGGVTTAAAASMTAATARSAVWRCFYERRQQVLKDAGVSADISPTHLALARLPMHAFVDALAACKDDRAKIDALVAKVKKAAGAEREKIAAIIDSFKALAGLTAMAVNFAGYNAAEFEALVEACKGDLAALASEINDGGVQALLGGFGIKGVTRRCCATTAAACRRWPRRSVPAATRQRRERTWRATPRWQQRGRRWQPRWRRQGLGATSVSGWTLCRLSQQRWQGGRPYPSWPAASSSPCAVALAGCSCKSASARPRLRFSKWVAAASRASASRSAPGRRPVPRGRAEAVRRNRPGAVRRRRHHQLQGRLAHWQTRAHPPDTVLWTPHMVQADVRPDLCRLSRPSQAVRRPAGVTP